MYRHCVDKTVVCLIVYKKDILLRREQEFNRIVECANDVRSRRNMRCHTGGLSQWCARVLTGRRLGFAVVQKTLGSEASVMFVQLTANVLVHRGVESRAEVDVGAHVYAFRVSSFERLRGIARA